MMNPKENKENIAVGYQPTKSDDEKNFVCIVCGKIEEDFETCVCGGELTLKKKTSQKNEVQEKKVEVKKVLTSPSSSISPSSTSATASSSCFSSSPTSSSSPTFSSSQLPVGERHLIEWMKNTPFSSKFSNTDEEEEQEEKEEEKEEKEESSERDKRSYEGKQDKEQNREQKLRPIVIDGSNISMLHGNNKKFSVRGKQRLLLSLSSLSFSLFCRS